MSKGKKILLASAVVLAVGVIALAVYSFTSFQFIKVSTGSMANTVIPGEILLCERRVGQIKRGDLVLFKMPKDQKVTYLQRIIGLPGERIQIRGTKVYLNAQELPEARTFVSLENREGLLPELSSEGTGPYRVYYEQRDDREHDGPMGMKFGVEEEYQIPPDHYFTMGDSRDNSLDGRYWGTVPRALIVGKAAMIIASDHPKRQDKLYQPLK